MQTPQQLGSHSQSQSQQLPPNDLPTLNMAPIPQLNLATRDHDPASYLSHPSAFGTTLTDPTNPYGEPTRPLSSSHDPSHVLPSFPHHPHPM